MIVNWKKENAGILNIPCLVNGTIDKYVTVLPGHNEVDNKEWEAAKPSATRLLKSNDLVELVEKRTTMVDGAPKFATKHKGEVDFEKNFPYNDILAIMKHLKIYKKVTTVKLEETEKKNLTKEWLIGYFKDSDEGQTYWDSIQDQFTESEKEEDKQYVAITLDDMEPQIAKDVVLDTYNLKTLDLWLQQISQPDLRVVIMNQITTVNEPPKKV